MGLFSRKRKNEEESEKEIEESGSEKSGQKKLFKKKDLKDLGSGNKRARREPKKPWGQSERVLVLVVVLLTAGLSAYLWLGSVGWQLPKIPKVNFSFPNIFTEETIILEKDR